MGLIDALDARLAGWAVRRPHLLLVPVPGATAIRLEAERVVAASGVRALTPADADVLLLAGEPGAELAAAVETAWSQLPGPRAHAQATTPDAVGATLAAALAELSTGRWRRAESERQTDWPDEKHREHHGDDGEGSGHSDGQDKQHGSEDHGGHGGHGGGTGDMPMPGGLMMADRAPDRDGLTLDVLRVPLGPVLPDWPAGLVVDLVLQGDVVQEATPRLLPPATLTPELFWHGGASGAACVRRHAAARLDSLMRFLGVIGAPAHQYRARRLRDALLAEADLRQVLGELAVLRRRLRRSATLSWAGDGLGVVTGSGPLAGDVTARWRRWLDDAGGLLFEADAATDAGPRGRREAGRWPSTELLERACGLMVGLDLAAARIVLASFDPDPDELAADRVAVAPAGTE